MEVHIAKAPEKFREVASIVRPETALAAAISGLGTKAFPAALDRWLKTLAPSDNTVMIAYRGDRRPLVLYKSYASPEVYAAFDEYLEAAYLLDPFYLAHLERVPAGFHRLSDLVPETFKRSAYYRSYYRETTLVDEVTAFAYSESGCTLNVCLGKDWTSNRPFTQRDLARLKDHEEIVQALLERNWAQLRMAEDAPPSPLPPRELDAADLARALARTRRITLTPRQAEVALLILHGHATAAIALHLGISPQTVKVHRKQLYARCGIGSQVELFSLLVPLMAELTDGPAKSR